MREHDIEMKYIVLKLEDIRKYLSNEQQDIFWDIAGRVFDAHKKGCGNCRFRLTLHCECPCVYCKGNSEWRHLE